MVSALLTAANTMLPWLPPQSSGAYAGQLSRHNHQEIKLPNTKVDWNQAPEGADGWQFNAATGPEWLRISHWHAHSIHDPIEKIYTFAPHGTAPRFEWEGSQEGSLTIRGPA
jgi:hypothetical protein